MRVGERLISWPRDSEPVPNATTVVVRGGVMREGDLRRNALITQRQHGFYGVSVFAAVSMTVEQLLAGPVYVPHARICTARVGRLSASGYELRRTLALPYHFDIVLDDVADETLVELLACFDPPVANPWPRQPPQ